MYLIDGPHFSRLVLMGISCTSPTQIDIFSSIY
jgi:hypothetical protein